MLALQVSFILFWIVFGLDLLSLAQMMKRIQVAHLYFFVAGGGVGFIFLCGQPSGRVCVTEGLSCAFSLLLGKAWKGVVGLQDVIRFPSNMHERSFLPSVFQFNIDIHFCARSWILVHAGIFSSSLSLWLVYFSVPFGWEYSLWWCVFFFFPPLFDMWCHGRRWGPFVFDCLGIKGIVCLFWTMRPWLVKQCYLSFCLRLRLCLFWNRNRSRHFHFYCSNPTCARHPC